MKVYLISKDTSVRELLARVARQTSNIDIVRETAPDADVYIWDFDPSLPTPIHKGKLTLVLSDVSLLPALSGRKLYASACVLLKPVTEPMLRAFLEAARNRAVVGVSCDSEALRMDRDTLLEYVLETNVRLQEYDHCRTNFLARALHDLRAPLTALHGYCGLLAEGQVGYNTDMQRELFCRMRRSTGRALRLASDMFELSVEGRVQRKLELVQGDIEDTVAQALHELHESIRDKEVSLTVALEPPASPFIYSPEQIAQALVNVLDNAFRFTPKGGRIELRGYPVHRPELENAENPGSIERPNSYRIDIRDSGPGIHPDQVATIFEQYVSYSGGCNRTGAGLGLAICKQIVVAHGGRIWAESNDQGASFSMVLPFTPRSRATLPGRKSEWN